MDEQIVAYESLEKSINEKDATINTLTEDKENLSVQFNDATEKLTSLNSKLEDLKEIEEKYKKSLKKH